MDDDAALFSAWCAGDRTAGTALFELGGRVGDGDVVHPGTTRLPLGGGVTAIPFRELWRG